MPKKVSRAAVPFFTLAAKYHIAPNANPDRLFDDANCLLSSAIGALEGMPDQGKQPPIYWAALYLLKMAEAAYIASTPKPNSAAGAGGVE